MTSLTADLATTKTTGAVSFVFGLCSPVLRCKQFSLQTLATQLTATRMALAPVCNVAAEVSAINAGGTTAVGALTGDTGNIAKDIVTAVRAIDDTVNCNAI